jgi:hypothetical protein
VTRATFRVPADLTGQARPAEANRPEDAVPVTEATP